MTTAQVSPASEGMAENVFVLPVRYDSVATRAQLVGKRLCDAILAGIGVVVLLPLFAAIAVAILVTSGRPVLYAWKVVGRRGRFFTGYKFRTMVRDADAQLTQLEKHNEMSGPVFKMTADPRVTPIGRILRKLSLDELPQLWSVLVGDMSLVGPRPPLRTEWERFAPWQRRKLAVTPGITCLWQVSGRSNITDFDDWVRMDIEYIDSWSLVLDFRILIRTVSAVLLARGAR